MKIASWNVNSIRARMEHLLGWLQDQSPDVVGLQETKVQDADFPADDIKALGYQVCFAGQKSYNGVAILSRQPARDVCAALDGAEEAGARFISATFPDGDGGDFRFVNVYVINGKEVGCEAYDRKLDFVSRLSERIQAEARECPAISIVGDFNIAPEDIDVYDPVEWHEKILCSSRERAALADLLEQTSTHDSLRELNPEETLYTWWDYRMMRYRRKQGMRIDHILLSDSLRSRCRRCWVDEAPRKLDKPSDHTPVIAEF